MRSRKREVNIFNMSVLDLLTGALGAFCFLTLALFPSYYGGAAQQRDLAKVQAALKKAEKQENKIQQEIRNPKPHSKQVPPFALLVVNSQTMSEKGPDFPCAGLTIQSAEVPPGSPAMRYQVGNRKRDLGIIQYNLYAFRAGKYRLVLNATTAGSCSVVLHLVNGYDYKEWAAAPGANQNSAVEFDFKITPRELSEGLFQ